MLRLINILMVKCNTRMRFRLTPCYFIYILSFLI
jgi:hypothetical protein